jgi:DNA polymerase III delta prime subunit
MMKEHILWTEKYRPQTVNDCILPEKNKKPFREFVKSGVIPNLMLYGSPGVGKTTIAMALCKEMDYEYMYINASLEGNIDTLRTKIMQFCSTISLSGSRKAVILDEADGMNQNSTQPALKGFIEEFARSCSFIFTCNHLNKILPAIQGRCALVEFRIDKADKVTIATEFLGMIHKILKAEKVDYDDAVLVELVKKHFPNFRAAIHSLQRYSMGGKIDVGILANFSEVKLTELIKSLKTKDFPKVRKWVVENSDNDSARVFRAMYDSFSEKMNPKSIPQAILILAEYQYKAAFVADAEINILACLTNIMLECEWI